MPSLTTLALAAAAATASPTSQPPGARQGAQLVERSSLPLQTSGRNVVGADGRPIRLACLNWYGAHLPQMVATGLDVRPVQDIASTVAELGFNCVRLPFSLDMVFENRTQVPEPTRWLAANPDLQQKSPLEVFDAVVRALTSAGLLVILNNHISTNGWCCGFRDTEGLWYTTKYPESMWLDGLSLMAARYRGDPRVAGFDLRNELRPSNTLVPTWGSGDERTDWAMAAEKGGERVLKENKNMLIVVSGLLYCMFLCDVPSHPVHLHPALRGHTVYTVHEYTMTSIHMQAQKLFSRWLPRAAAVQCCLWLLLLAGRPWRHRNAPVDGSPRLRSSRKSRCVLEGLALLLPIVVLAGVVLAFSRYVPSCGFTWELPTLAAIVAVVVLTLTSLGLWLSMVLLLFCAPKRHGREDPIERPLDNGLEVLGCASAGVVGQVPMWPSSRPEELIRQASLETGSGPRTVHVKRCGMRPKCSRPLVASVLTAAAVLVSSMVCLTFSSYSSFEKELDRRWGFLLGDDTEASAPVWLGEFGETKESQWWEYMTRYLQEHQEVGWAYWSLNGDPKHPYMALLLEDTKSVRHPWKLEALQSLMFRAPE